MTTEKEARPSQNQLQAFGSQGKVPRRANADGTMTIYCRICEKPLMRAVGLNFSTVTCSDCAGKSTAGMVTGEVRLPDGRIVYAPQVFNDAVLYTEKPELEKVGLARAVFRALGFGRPKEPKQPASESKAVSKERRRKPLFDGKED